MRTKIKSITPELIGQKLTVCGWVRSVRDQKSFAFIEVNDGSRLGNLQVIADNTLRTQIDQITTGTSLQIVGELVESPGQKQLFELKAEEIEI